MKVKSIHLDAQVPQSKREVETLTTKEQLAEAELIELEAATEISMDLREFPIASLVENNMMVLLLLCQLAVSPLMERRVKELARTRYVPLGNLGAKLMPLIWVMVRLKVERVLPGLKLLGVVLSPVEEAMKIWRLWECKQDD